MEKKDARIIVFGNEKGGTGKSTLAMHIVVGLLNEGHRVAVIDLDSRQKSVARYLQNRQTFMANGGDTVHMPAFAVVTHSDASLIKDRETEDQKNLQTALNEFKESVEFIIIDCPGNDTYLSRLAHALADTLVTPINDSFVDLDLLGEVSAESYEVKKLSFYSEMVWDSRKFRSASGKPPMDWVVIRSRLASLDSRNNKRVHKVLESLQKRIMFRYVAGLYERVIYKELFPRGLTVLDMANVTNLSHVAARQEVRSLLEKLNLS